jgi:hypothetical protein
MEEEIVEISTIDTEKQSIVNSGVRDTSKEMTQRSGGGPHSIWLTSKLK